MYRNTSGCKVGKVERRWDRSDYTKAVTEIRNLPTRAGDT